MEEPPEALVTREATLAKEVKQLEVQTGRCFIRRRRDTERELRQVQEEIMAFTSGRKKREYLLMAQPYLCMFQKVKSDDHAITELQKSLARLTEQHFSTTPFRKRTKLERTIQMADGDKSLTHGSLTDEFMASVHGCAPPVYINQCDICPHCDMVLKRESENTLVCEECGITILTQDSSLQGGTQGESERQTNKMQYKQEQHFRDKLKMISNVKVTCDISATIVGVQNEIQKCKVPADNGHSLRLVRQLIEKTNRKHSAFAIPIWCAVTGNPIPIVTNEERNVLCQLFAQFAAEFEHVKKSEQIVRKNMLSYPYLIHKFCVKEKYRHLAPFFAVQKCDANLVKIENLCKKTYARLGWPFVSYVDEPSEYKGDLCAVSD